MTSDLELKLDIETKFRISWLTYKRRLVRNKKLRQEKILKQHKQVISKFHKLNSESSSIPDACCIPENRTNRKGGWRRPDSFGYLTFSFERKIRENIEFFDEDFRKAK